jgi:hypothetical protein
VTQADAEAVFKLVAGIREKRAQEAVLLAELEHTVAIEVGTQVTLKFTRFISKHAIPCTHCGHFINIPNDAIAVKVGDRYWHMFHCKKGT